MKKLTVLILAIALAYIPYKGSSQIVAGFEITLAPPVLPVYEQPPCPFDGYIWVPGYWAYGPDGYYWVPGVWVLPPDIDLLWTPGYWAFEDGFYYWHGGYWGPHVGFYGGVYYGFGYYGTGFYGGRWEGGTFRYNTAVWNVNRAAVRNVYVDRTVVNNYSGSRASFNGPGGVSAKPTAAERTAMNEGHRQPTADQQRHQQSASTDRNQLATVNRGHPSTLARSSISGTGGGHNAASHTSNNRPASKPATSNPSHSPARTQPQGVERNQPRPAERSQPHAVERSQPRPPERGQPRNTMPVVTPKAQPNYRSAPPRQEPMHNTFRQPPGGNRPQQEHGGGNRNR